MDTIFDKFVRVTNYDLGQYFTDYTYFLDNYFQSIVSYYKGKSSPNKDAFSELNRLITESNKIEQIISLMSSSLSATTDFWDLIDTLAVMKTKLESTVNLAKWLRSSYIYGYENQSKRKYILKQNQTFENLSLELGSDNSNEDWLDISISNGVTELDYSKAGGNVLDVKNIDNRTMNVTSVVDVMVGDNILGKDLPNKIEIDEDGIVALDTVDTMEQSAEICLSVVKGSVPEFPNLGISKNLIGSIINSLRFSSLSREVNNNFRTDDSFSSIKLMSNSIKDDMAFYEFKIVSRLNNELNKTL
jgi:hypothetical protein